MKKSKILLFSLYFLSTVASFCQVPVIISQPTTLNVCEGDSVTLEVIADTVYNLQWFTALSNADGFYNYEEIPGENYYKLARSPVVLSVQPGNLYYFMRLVSPKDTLWSAGIRIDVISLNKPLDDTVQVNKLPGHIRIPWAVMSAQLIWSTGDTSDFPPERDYVEFDHPGKYWLTSNALGCSRTDTFQVVLCPAVIHIDTSSNKTQCWCADTVYIDDNVTMAGVTILPGTTVKFTGDYSLRCRYIDARGIEEDSIYILGNIDPVLHTRQGCIRSWDLALSEGPRNNFENVVVKNMHRTELSRGGTPDYFENDSVVLYQAGNSTIGYNKRVVIMYSLYNSTVIGNDTVIGISSSLPKGGISCFYCNRNIFRSNNAGLILVGLDPFNGYPIHVWNNVFVDNKSAAITLKSYASYIDQNLFINNTAQTGPPVLMGDFKKVAVDKKNYSYNLTFRNNTLYNNLGKNCNGISFSDSATISGSAYNNIFWNINTKNPVDVVIANSASGKFTISNNSFSGNETSVVMPADTNFTAVNNLFLTDPVFSDPLNHLLTLRHCSPLIDRGLDITHGPPMVDFFFSADLNGFPRKTGNAVDIGAYEYHPVVPLAFSYVTPDTMACTDDSITLKVIPEGGYRDDFYTYQWYKNGNVFTENDYQNIFYIDPAALSDGGTYQAAVSNGTDTLWSPPIHVSIPRLPVIDEQPVSRQVCKGMNINIACWAPNSQQFQYAWYSKNNGPLPSTVPTCYINNVTENDTVYVTASNHCGSDTSEPILLIVSPVPEPALGVDTCINAADSLLLDAGPAISYTWSTGGYEQKVYAYASDTLWVVATNAYSCSGSDTIIIFLSPVTGEPFASGNSAFLFYPNPTKDRLFLRLAGNTDLPCRISIFSQDGRLITETKIKNREEQVIDVSEFEKGIYFIRLQSADVSGIGKFIVQ
jgi:hypothetical protein